MTESRVVDYPLLTVAKGLAAEADSLERGGDIEKSRWHCAGGLALICAALEGCINVYAGFYYSGPGVGDAAKDGWPDSWFRPGGHRPHVKWQCYGRTIAGRDFTANQPALRDWQNRLQRLFDDRNDLVMHFKGAWSTGDTDARWNALCAKRLHEELDFARALIARFIAVFRCTHPGSYSDRPVGPALIDAATGMTGISHTTARLIQGTQDHSAAPEGEAT